MSKKKDDPESHETVTPVGNDYRDIISQILAGPANQEIKIKYWHEPEDDSQTLLWLNAQKNFGSNWLK